MNLPDLFDVRAHVNTTSTTGDGELRLTLDQAIAYVEGEVGVLAPRTVTERQRHSGGPLLLLRQPPVLSLTSVTPLLADGTLGSPFVASRFVVDSGAGLATYLGPERLGTGWLEVVYTAGRPANGLPADLFGAVLEQTAILWESQRRASTRGAVGPEAQAALMPRIRRRDELLRPHLLSTGVVV